MKIIDFIRQKNINNSLLIGYYGGGNYGDELLMETVLNLLEINNAKNISVFYLNYVDYDKYHKKFDNYQIINKENKIGFLIKLLKSKNILIGGGGIWGLDFNFNVFLLSLIVFVSRFLLFKKVYLLGIGYYNSTSSFGKIGAYLVGKASNLIIARDEETCVNFKKISKNVFHDCDFAYYIPEIDENKYQKETTDLGKKLDFSKKTLFITIRRFSAKHQNNYDKMITEIIAVNDNRRIVLALLENSKIYPAGFDYLKSLSKQHKNLAIIDFEYNPLALFYLFKKHRNNIIVISPQLHGQIISYLAGVKFLPIGYDDKNIEFFKKAGVKDYFDIKKMTLTTIQDFINKHCD